MAKSKRGARPEAVCQFLIVLSNTDPLVWRRIQIPESYSFWDLHVAIQDAMGWNDTHLHEFTFIDSKKGREERIGSPNENMPASRTCRAGWEVPITTYLNPGMAPLRYWYDFGDDWRHSVEFEEVLLADEEAYPRCVAGANACPPEDVGGPHRYREFLEAILDDSHPEHDEFKDWIGGEFDPAAFSLKAVTFDDPRERWRTAFDGIDQSV